MTEISFGDNVRVLTTPLTSDLGIAGMVGQVFGQTVPSSSGVEVVGTLTSDYAINVYFEAKGEGVWLPEELLEFVDHAPGATFGLAGQEWVRAADGTLKETEESEFLQSFKEVKYTAIKPKWWKLW